MDRNAEQQSTIMIRALLATAILAAVVIGGISLGVLRTVTDIGT